jgi:hypothetical protein
MPTLVGTRSRANRGRTFAAHLWCGASDRIRISARPARYVHRSVPDMPPRTRRSAAIIGGGTPEMTIGRADADPAGARPYLFLERFLDRSVFVVF